MISTEKVCEEMRQWRVDHRGMAVKMPEQRKYQLFPTFSPSFQDDHLYSLGIIYICFLAIKHVVMGVRVLFFLFGHKKNFSQKALGLK